MRHALLLCLLALSLPACMSSGGGMSPEMRSTLLIGLAIDDYNETGDAAGLTAALGEVLDVPGGSMLADLTQVYVDYTLTGDQEAARAGALAVLGFDSVLVAEGVEPDPLILQVAKRFLRDDPELDADLVARLLTARMGLAALEPAAPATGAG